MKEIKFADKFKTVSELCELKGQVYVKIPTSEKRMEFMRRAEEEGFTFGDGAKPTNRECDRIMAVNKDKTINYVNYIGAMAYGAAKRIGDQKLIRVVY